MTITPAKSFVFDGASIRDVPLSSWRPGWLTGTQQMTALSSYRAVAWVYRCVTLRAQAVGAMPYTVTRSGNEIDWPLPLTELLYLTEAALCVYGCSYWFRERNRVKLLDLRWLHPTTMEPVTDADEGLTGFKRTLQGRQQSLELDDVVYFWLPNLEGELGPGTSPAKVALEAAGLAHYTNQFAGAFFQRGAIPAVLLSVEGNPADAELRRLETWWRRLLQGVKRAWETVAVRAVVKPQIIGSPLKDLAIKPLLAEARSQIAVSFGVPQTMMEDAANFATAREHKLSFYHETIIPECRQIESALNEQLFDPLGLAFEFLPEQLEALQQDEATKATSLVELFKVGLISASEAREQLGLAVAEQEQEQEAEQEQPPMPPPLTKAAFQDLARWRRSGKGAEFVSEHIPAWLRSAIEYRLHDEQLRDHALDPCVRAYDRGGAEGALAEKIERALTEALPDIEQDVSKAQEPDLVNLENALLSVLAAGLAAIALDWLLAQMMGVGVGVDYGAVALLASDWARQYSYKLIKESVIPTTRKHLQNVISQLAEGVLTKDDAIAMLQPMFSEARAQAIAVTEITRAMSQGTLLYKEQLEALGLRVTETWATARDSLVCKAICEPLEGKGRDVWGRDFPTGPPAHPNCRCELLLTVKRK